MNAHVNKIDSLLFYTAAAILYAGMIFFTYRYEMTSFFTFDEAGQFWIAQGLNHDSAPMSVRGDFREVIENNKNYNLDPGGYGILLHAWTVVGQNYLWLRSLSFVFFLITVAAFGFLSFRWTGKIYIAVLAGIIPFVVPLLYHYGFLLRGYSMEVLGCTICAIAVWDLQQRLTIRWLLLYSILISFFLTSRYSFMIVAFVTSLYIYYLIFKSTAGRRYRWGMVATFATPIFLTLVISYLCALRYQNPQLQPLSFYLPYIYLNNKIEWKVLCTRYTFRHLLYIVILVDLACRCKSNEHLRSYLGLIFITSTTILLFFIFSCLGKHPWCASHCVSMEVLIVLVFTALGCEIVKRLPNKFEVKYLLLAIGILAFSYYKDDCDESKNAYNVLTELRQINPTAGKVFVDYQESPFVRYLFEYGEFQGAKNYPHDFTFVTYRKHGFNTGETIKFGLDVLYREMQPSMDELYEGYDVLIIPDYYRYRPQKTDKWVSVNGRKSVWIKNPDHISR